MAFVTIPLSNLPNQSMLISLPINGKNINVILKISYKEICGYWLMSILDANTRKSLIENIPLLNGYPNKKSANVLQQFQYLELGSAFVIKTTDIKLDSPDDTTLGSEFTLVWGDNIDYIG